MLSPKHGAPKSLVIINGRFSGRDIMSTACPITVRCILSTMHGLSDQ